MTALRNLFDIAYGVNLEVVNCEIAEDGIPFVSRQSVNNGVACRVRMLPDVDPNPAWTLSIAGGGSVLSTFFHEEPYYSGRDIYVATPRFVMSREEMLFYRMVIERNRFRYSYGRQANRTLRDLRVPEYGDAEGSYVKRKVPFADPAACQKHTSLSSVVSWKSFRYGDLFEIRKGKRLTKEDMVAGAIPFIGATDSDNGITAYVGNDENLYDGNKITVSYNGSIAESFYQPVPFVASDDVNVLEPKFDLDKYIGLFLCTLIRREKYRYNYGRKWHAEKMRESRIRLPVKADGQPDWPLMRDYVRGLAYSAAI